jgi:indole-3-glycerol phosphate synthase
MTILDRILEKTRERVSARRRAVPIGSLSRQYAAPRPFFSVKGVTVIAECKKASPSKGILCNEYDPVSIASQLASGGATALSVITEQDFFLGSLSDFDAVRRTTVLPMIRKDFIVGEYQIVEAWAHGADAVLLIAAALDDFQLKDLNDAAHARMLTVLCEAHDENEIERALALPDAAIGVNARDLRDFSVSLERTMSLASMIPPDRDRVGESGIFSSEDAVRLVETGYNALLIGEYFLRSPDRAATVSRLVDAVNKKRRAP